MKYNKALDYTVLAMKEMLDGKPVLAARLFAKAVEQPDAVKAMAILEASNAAAFKVLQASKVQASAAPKARLLADAEGDVVEPVEPELEEDDLAGDPLEQVADVEDGDPIEDDHEVEPDQVEESPAMAVAKVLSSMRLKAK